jgi:hypothetical protein
MKHIGTKLTMLILAASLAGSASAANNGILVKDDAGNNYCHMKFPAMTARSLVSKQPQLKSAQTGDVVDYSGSCDESPTGKDQILEQKHEESFMFGRDYEDGE